MTEKEYTTEFQKALNDYIKLGFNQDECNGFMHGFHKGAEAVKKLNIDDVSKSFNCELCEDAGVNFAGMDCICDKAPKK